jgi:hypothetical protein
VIGRVRSGVSEQGRSSDPVEGSVPDRYETRLRSRTRILPTGKRLGWRRAWHGTFAAILLAAPLPVHAIDLIGQQVDLTYDFGDGSGSLSATVGPGPEFVLEGSPANGPAFSTATIDITANTLTLTHNRSTNLGPGLPVVSDDFLIFSFPNLPGGSILDVMLTADPMPTWFAGLSFTDTSLTLTQLDSMAGVDTALKVWTFDLLEPPPVVKIGTWSLPPGSGNPTGNGGPGIAQGQRFVVVVEYDPDSPVVVRDILTELMTDSGQDLSAIDLDGIANILDVYVPMEGLDGSIPFIYRQTEADHFPAFTPLPSLNFTLGSGVADPANIIGLEYEGDFFPGAGFNVIEMFNTAAGAVSPVDHVIQILNCGDPTCTGAAAIAVRTVDGLVDAVPVSVADATVNYDAGAFSYTTSLFFQGNDLGAARGDGENFLTSSWTMAGEALPGVMQPNNVDIEVALVDSGLTTTASTATWNVAISEQMTGLGDTAEIQVGYMNSPATASLSATATPTGYDFSFSFEDPDLAANALIPDFEQLTFAARVDGQLTSVFDELLSTGSQTMSSDALLAAFGEGTFSLLVTISERFGIPQSASATFVVPEPGVATGLFSGAGLMMGFARRRRRG